MKNKKLSQAICKPEKYTDWISLFLRIFVIDWRCSIGLHSFDFLFNHNPSWCGDMKVCDRCYKDVLNESNGW